MQHALSESTTNYERKKDQINAFECVVYFYSFFYKKKKITGTSFWRIFFPRRKDARAQKMAQCLTGAMKYATRD